jgi:hemolysin III
VREERLSSIIHAAGFLLSAALMLLLIIDGGNRGFHAKHFGAGVFSLCAMTLYGISAVYHFVRSPGRKRLFRLLDHASVYLLIAGTYTPFIITYAEDNLRTLFLILIWSLAGAGITAKIFLMDKLRFLSVIFYIALGWLSIAAWGPLLSRMPVMLLVLLFTGGFFYTGGTLFYAAKKIHYNHAAWHVCVLIGTLCHGAGVAFFVL